MRFLLPLVLSTFFPMFLPTAHRARAQELQTTRGTPAASDVQKAPLWLETLQEAHQLAVREQRPILIHFWATSCGPCLQLEKTVFFRSDVRDAIRSNFASVKIDTAQEPDLARHFQIRSIPMDVIVGPDGSELHRQISPQDAGQYLGMLQHVAARARLAQAPPPSPAATGWETASHGPAHHAPPAARADRNQGHEPQFAEPGRAEPPLAMEGYCPVTLVDDVRWQPGNPQGSVLHAERWYRFASPEYRQRFLQNPERYVPAFSGYDIVRFRELGKMVMGKRDHGVVFGDRYYLFADEEGLRQFWNAPDHYAERPSTAYNAQSAPQTFSR